MHPALHSQADDPAEFLKRSVESAISFDPTTDMTRQEHAASTDLNRLLTRFGANAPLRPPQYIDVDYDLDLAGAYHSVEVARAAHRELPADLRKEFPSWVHVLNGLAAGKLKIRPDKDPDGGPAVERVPAPVPAAPAAPSP